MKIVKLYAIVDRLSESILSIFTSVSEDFAVKQYLDALKKNEEKIYDINDVSLVSLGISYNVPETFDEIISSDSTVVLYSGKNSNLVLEFPEDN